MKQYDPMILSVQFIEFNYIVLLLNGKRPIDVAIELDLSSNDVENILQEYWVLTGLDDLALAYVEIKNHLALFIRLFHVLKKNKLINQNFMY
jgi:hypothetical protein